MEDTKWRVRKEAMQTVINLSMYFVALYLRTVKNYDVFTKHLEPVFVMFMKDRAAEVRQIGLSKLQDLIAIYKIDWALGPFLNKVIEVLTKDNNGFVLESLSLALQDHSDLCNSVDFASS